MGGQSPVLELALADLALQTGHAAAMRQLRTAVAARMDAVRHAIAQSFPPGTRVSDPSGGLLLWVELPRGAGHPAVAPGLQGAYPGAAGHRVRHGGASTTACAWVSVATGRSTLCGRAVEGGCHRLQHAPEGAFNTADSS